jgi:hypothetical protein
VELRQSISKTHLRTEDADLAIWNNPKGPGEPSPAK